MPATTMTAPSALDRELSDAVTLEEHLTALETAADTLAVTPTLADLTRARAVRERGTADAAATHLVAAWKRLLAVQQSSRWSCWRTLRRTLNKQASDTFVPWHVTLRTRALLDLRTHRPTYPIPQVLPDASPEATPTYLTLTADGHLLGHYRTPRPLATAVGQSAVIAATAIAALACTVSALIPSAQPVAVLIWIACAAAYAIMSAATAPLYRRKFTLQAKALSTLHPDVELRTLRLAGRALAGVIDEERTRIDQQRHRRLSDAALLASAALQSAESDVLAELGGR